MNTWYHVFVQTRANFHNRLNALKSPTNYSNEFQLQRSQLRKQWLIYQLQWWHMFAPTKTLITCCINDFYRGLSRHHRMLVVSDRCLFSFHQCYIFQHYKCFIVILQIINAKIDFQWPSFFNNSYII